MRKNYRRRRSKVKRYRRSFYTPAMKVKRAVSIAVLVVVVLVVAWFAAPHVLNWATHTWYTVVRGRDLEAESAASAAVSQAASSEAAASSKAQAASSRAASSQAASSVAAKEETASGTAVVEGSWAAVERASLGDEAAIRAAAQQLKQQGVTYALVTLKDSAGHIYYPSSVAAASGSVADAVVDPAQIASIFKEYGLVPVAQLAAFRDPIAPYTDRTLAIHYRSNGETDYLWLDAASVAAGGKPWINPYAAGSVTFIGDLVAEVHEMGFDQVMLSYVQFPSAVSSKQDFGSTGGLSRQEQLAADIAAWNKRFDGAVTLWYRYSLAECTDTSSILGAPAVQLGVENLVVEVPTKSSLNEEERAALLQTAADAGVAHTVVRDETAGYFE